MTEDKYYMIVEYISNGTKINFKTKEEADRFFENRNPFEWNVLYKKVSENVE